jgi:hypothetical protein
VSDGAARGIGFMSDADQGAKRSGRTFDHLAPGKSRCQAFGYLIEFIAIHCFVLSSITCAASSHEAGRMDESAISSGFDLSSEGRLHPPLSYCCVALWTPGRVDGGSAGDSWKQSWTF